MCIKCEECWEIDFSGDLHRAMLNTVAHFLYRKECRTASEVLKDTISRLRYMLHIMSLQKGSANERVKTFKWHLIATQFRPIAHILDVCILNDLNMCQLSDKLLGALIMYPLIKYLYNSILKCYLRYLFLKYLVSCNKILFLVTNSIL